MTLDLTKQELEDLKRTIKTSLSNTSSYINFLEDLRDPKSAELKTMIKANKDEFSRLSNLLEKLEGIK